MRRDYARYRTKKRAPKKNWRQTGIFMLGFLVMLAVMGGYWIYQHKATQVIAEENKVTSAFTRMKTMFSHNKTTPVLANKEQIATPKQEVHFDFYSELPTMQVTPAVIEETRAPPPLINAAAKKAEQQVELSEQTTAEVEKDFEKHGLLEKKTDTQASMEAPQFILQLGLFEDVNGASQSRLSLLLGGFESDVIKMANEGKEKYRVQQGPFSNEAQAKIAQKRLERKGVMSTVKKLD